uniref:Immediate early response 2 n=1 Tax=Spermophilus dauricus TaxID=99837 RepID=A0A8C9PNB8_SPEDA
MEVQKEAQRIMTLSVWKMYHSRMQRGGLRLHRSLQLSLVMRSARELYLSAKVEAQEPEVSSPPAKSPDPRLHPPREAETPAEVAPPDGEQPSPEPMDTQEEASGAQETNARGARPLAKVSRKRRSSSLSDGGDAGLVPSKKARLEEEEEEGASSEVPARLLPAPAQHDGVQPHVPPTKYLIYSTCGFPAAPNLPVRHTCEAKAGGLQIQGQPRRLRLLSHNKK